MGTYTTPKHKKTKQKSEFKVGVLPALISIGVLFFILGLIILGNIWVWSQIF